METSERPLVSIVTPCYNGEKYIRRFLDSVLNQTYPNIEMVIINDGSTDNTEKIIQEYVKKFETKGYSLLCHSQENSGQSAAINYGLRIIRGKYFTWPDSDDILTEDCIEKKVAALEENTDASMVCCREAVIDDDKPDTVKCILERKCKSNENFFIDLIMENDAMVNCGSYLVNLKDLLSCLKDGQIYDVQKAQNWQLLLPLAYSKKCIFINDILYYYYIHKNSHSAQSISDNQIFQTTYDHEEILLKTIDRLHCKHAEKRKFRRIIKNKYLKKRLHFAKSYCKYEWLDRIYPELIIHGMVDTYVISEKLGYWKHKNQLVYYGYRIVFALFSIMRKLNDKRNV